MPEGFITRNFLLQNETARRLYFEYASQMPIFDYHSHLPAREIADDTPFSNILQLWLSHDHYKWRAMRANGIDERYITGNAVDYEKFQAWAETVPATIRNPLYHWTHMELKTYFHIEDMLLNRETAAEIYRRCNLLLEKERVSPRSLLKGAGVKLLCTTNDPVESLDCFGRISEDDSCNVRVFPTFRPDRAFMIEDPRTFNEWISKLEKVSDHTVVTLSDLISALRQRHDAFHTAGCRSADHGIEYPYTESYTIKEIERIFDVVRCGKAVSKDKVLQFKSFMLRECTQMTTERYWVQQLHLGALRNNNTRYLQKLGPDSGFDGIGDFEIARPLVRFLDYFEKKKNLPKTVLYNINPCDNEIVASIAGCFQGGGMPSKIQFGPGWWFNDTKDGMIRQMGALSNLGLFSRFIGMTTDSRSFLSFSRHDYFRRILCNLLGEDVEKGELPCDMEFIGSIVQDICYNNASNYFRC